MRTNEALQLIEKLQKNFCYVGQSVTKRKTDKYSEETISAAGELSEQGIIALGNIKQEILRFLQDNPTATFVCQYSIDKPISDGADHGEVMTSQGRLLSLLTLCKKEMDDLTKGIITSNSDNRRFVQNDVFKNAVVTFNGVADKYFETISNDRALSKVVSDKKAEAEEKLKEAMKPKPEESVEEPKAPETTEESTAQVAPETETPHVEEVKSEETTTPAPVENHTETTTPTTEENKPTE